MPTRLVVADTGPLNYLLLIEAIDVLPGLFEQILGIVRPTWVIAVACDGGQSAESNGSRPPGVRPVAVIAEVQSVGR
jgi:hypothetical protein